MSDYSEQELMEYNEQQAELYNHELEGLNAGRIEMDNVVLTSFGDFASWVTIRMSAEELDNVCSNQGWEKEDDYDSYIDDESERRAYHDPEGNCGVFYSR